MIYPFRAAFSLPGFGAPTPPVSDDILVWLKGNNTNDELQKADSWAKPYKENFPMSKSACVSLNGTDEFGVLSRVVTLANNFNITLGFTDFGSADYALLLSKKSDNTQTIRRLLSSENYIQIQFGGDGYVFELTDSSIETTVEFKRVGAVLYFSDSGGASDSVACNTSTISFDEFWSRNDGDTRFFNGQAYNLHLQDATQDYHFRCAEKSGLTLYSDNYLFDGMYITMIAVEANLWAQTQDTYHGNSKGWWEINGDPVMYPYPVAGFDTYHEGGTFNDCETSYAPEEFPVGEPNGIDDTFTMDADHGTIVSHGSLDTSIPTYVHPTITFTAGIIRDILFSDGMLMQIREGEGSVLHDSEGNIVGTANVTLPTFWEGTPMVAQSIIDAEALLASPVLTDGAGHAIPRTQTELAAIDNNMDYMTACEGNIQFLKYKKILSIAEDAEVKVFGCL